MSNFELSFFLKRSFVLVIYLLCINSVSAELGGHCVDNVLFWNTYRGDAQTRDCSSLHTNAGVTYRGECRTYDGGAGCWKINGTVDHAYIIESRERYEAIINPAVTTTTLQPTVINLECPACPDTTCPEEKLHDDYLVALRYLNRTLEDCKEDLALLEVDFISRVPRADYDVLMIEYDKRVAGYRNETAAANKELEYVEDWRDFYKYALVVFGIISLFLVYVWVKRPELEDDISNI